MTEDQVDPTPPEIQPPAATEAERPPSRTGLAEGPPAQDGRTEALLAQPEQAGAEEPAALIEPDLQPPRGLVAATLVALAAVAMAAVWWAPSSPHATAPASDGVAAAGVAVWQVEASLLEEIQRDDAALLKAAAARGAAFAAAEATLQAEVAAVLAEEVTVGAAGLADDPTARERVGQVEERVRQLALAHGREAVQAAALRWSQRAVAALLPVAKAAAAGGGWQAALKGPAGAGAEQVAPGLARALASAHVERWVDAAGWQPAAELALQGLARQRFLAFAARIPTAQPLPERTEQLLLRWKAETHDGIGLDRRMALLQQLRTRDPSYPADFQAGRLLWQAGRCDAALPYLAEAVATRQRAADARVLQVACERATGAADATAGAGHGPR